MFPELPLHHSTAAGPVLLTFFQAVALSVLLGLLNSTILWTLRYVLVGLFTDDEEVARLAAGVMGILAIMQLSDAVSTGAHGLLRGIGQQHIGGYANLVGHYVFSLPFGLGTAFGLGWGLQGLWIGVASGVAGYVVSLSRSSTVFFPFLFPFCLFANSTVVGLHLWSMRMLTLLTGIARRERRARGMPQAELWLRERGVDGALTMYE